MSLVDTGSQVTIVPKSLLPSSFRLKPTSLKVKGVNASSKFVGYFMANVGIGDHTFRDCQVFVLDGEVPCLIGNNILKYPGVLSYTFNNSDKTLSFNLGASRTVTAKMASPMDILNECTALSVSVPLNHKLNFLVEEKGVQFPDGIPVAELEPLVELLFEFRDVLGSENDPHGVYSLREVRIPFNGESRAVHGNHIPQAL